MKNVVLNLRIVFLVASFFASGFANAFAKDGILRFVEGDVMYMSHDRAVEACPKDSHLPSIRELAVASQDRGAKGILELNQVTSGDTPPSGYFMVSVINPDRKLDAFYFNPEGYRRPDGEFGNLLLWSSSIDMFRLIPNRRLS